MSLQIPSVNFHLWQPCNMRCGFCFATFEDVRHGGLPKGHLPREDSLRVVNALAHAGAEKINFAGGEPTLCPWLPALIRRAKTHGMATSIVTNGSRIRRSPEWLDEVGESLDWAALSIDTVDPDGLRRLGRTLRSGPLTDKEYLQVAREIRRRGIRLKINTVVTSVTWREDFTGFISLAKPERWKLFQALPVKGQNDRQIHDFQITEEQFLEYVKRNRVVECEGIKVVPESNELMTGSYLMIDPAGRFFDNVYGFHTYSKPIIDVGVERALASISVKPDRFLRREGRYDW